MWPPRRDAPAARSTRAYAAAGVGAAGHHLAGRAHLRAARRRVGEAVAREDRFFRPRARRLARRGQRELRERLPSRSRQACSTSGTPVAFATNGTVREARGFASST